MKIRLAAIGIAVIAAAIFGLLGGSASIAQSLNDPIPGFNFPGVYIIVRKNPGGKAVQGKTDEKGKVVFANLQAGTYKLSVGKMPQTKSGMNNSSGWNTWYPERRMENGVEVVPVSIELGNNLPAPVEIEITKNGAKIIVTVTRAESGGDVKRSSQTGPITGGVAKPTPTPKSTPTPTGGSPGGHGGIGIGTTLAKPKPTPTPGGDEKPGIAGVPLSSIPVGLDHDPGGEIVMEYPLKQGSKVSYHNYIGIVTLVKMKPTITWANGFETRIVTPSEGKQGIAHQVAGNNTYRTALPKKGKNGILTYELVQVPVSNAGDVKLPGTEASLAIGTDGGIWRGPGSTIVMKYPPPIGSLVSYKGVNGIVTRSTGFVYATWEHQGVTRIVSPSEGKQIADQAAGGNLTSYRTAPPKKGKNGILTYELVPDSKSPPK